MWCSSLLLPLLLCPLCFVLVHAFVVDESSSAMVAHCADSARVCLNVCVFRLFSKCRELGSSRAFTSGLFPSIFWSRNRWNRSSFQCVLFVVLVRFLLLLLLLCCCCFCCCFVRCFLTVFCCCCCCSFFPSPGCWQSAIVVAVVVAMKKMWASAAFVVVADEVFLVCFLTRLLWFRSASVLRGIASLVAVTTRKRRRWRREERRRRRRRLRLFFSSSSGLLLRVLWPVFAGRKTDSSERVSCTLSELFFVLEEAAATSFFFFTFFFFCWCWLLSTLVALPFVFLRRHRHRFFRNKSDMVVVPLQIIYWTDSSSCCFLWRRRKGMKLFCSANTWLSEKFQLSSPFLESKRHFTHKDMVLLFFWGFCGRN